MNHVQIISDSAHRNYILFNPSTASAEDVYSFIEESTKRYPSLFFDVIFGGLIKSIPLEENVQSLIKKKNKKGEVNNFASVMKEKCIDTRSRGCFDNVEYHWVENRMKSENKDIILSIIEKKFIEIAKEVSTIKKKTKGEIFKKIREKYGNLFEGIVNEVILQRNTLTSFNEKGKSLSPDEKKMITTIANFKLITPEKFNIATKVIDRDLYFHKNNKSEFSLNFEELLSSPPDEVALHHFVRSYFLYFYDLLLIATIEGLYTEGKRPPLVKNVICYNEYKYNNLLIRYLRQLDFECFSNPGSKEEDFVSNVILSEIYSNDWEIIDLLFSREKEVDAGCPNKQ